MADIALCIATHCQTTRLRRTLHALAALDTVHRITVIVGDTQPAHSGLCGLDVCRELVEEGYRWPVIAIPLARRNMARVRNAMVAAAYDAGAPIYIGFLNDLSAPESGWLDALVAALRTEDTDFACGPAMAEFQNNPDAWVRASRFFERMPRPRREDFRPQSMDNCLIRSSVFAVDKKPWLDPDETLVGLSDALFLTTMAQNDVKFSWVEQARIDRLVEPHMTVSKWMRRAAFNDGRVRQATRRINGIATPKASQPLRDIAALLAILTAGVGLCIAGNWHARLRFAGERRIWTALGLIDGMKAPLKRPENRAQPRNAAPAAGSYT